MVDVEAAIRAQVIKQMNKLINVLQATDVTEAPAVTREMVLLRVRALQQNRTSILKEAEIFSARGRGFDNRGIRARGDRRSRKAG